MSGNWHHGGLDRAAERIRRIFGSEAEEERLEREEVERLRASGWRPRRPASRPAPEGGNGVADAGEAIARQMERENAYLAEARRRLAGRRQLAEVTRSRNNELVAGWGDRFDRSGWSYVGQIDAHRPTRTFNAGNRIAIEASSVAYPPTHQCRFTVHAQPMEADGRPQASVATAEWFKPVEYSSGPTGAGGPNVFVLQATSPAPRQRWTVSIPPQQAAHGNAAYSTLRIYVPREQ